MVKKFNAEFRIGQGGVVEVNSDVILDAASGLILVDATAGPVTVTLQRSDGLGGRRYCIKKVDSSPNTVTISPVSSQTIDGQASVTLSSENEFIDILSDNENWLIVGESMISAAIPHNFLSATHLDTTPLTPPTLGDLVKASGASKWARFGLGPANAALLINAGATDLLYALIKDANVDPLAAIAQSKIAGLLASLAAKLQTTSDVGVGVGKLTKAISGTDAPFKSILAGAGITVTNLADEVQIASSVGVNTFILGVMDDGALPNGTDDFVGIFSDDTAASEADTQGFLAFGFTIVRYTLRVNTNTKNMDTTFSARDDGVDVPNTSTIVAGGVTGSFDSGVISEAIAANSLMNFKMIVGGGTGALSDYSQLLECEK